MPKKEISVFTSNEIRKQFLNNYEKKKKMEPVQRS